MKTVEINGVTFEVIKKKEKLISGQWAQHDLLYHYNKPSIYKVRIYEWWREWTYACELLGYNVDWFSVTSANCNFFTICFVIKFEGHLYNAVITKSHNRLYLVA